jgi:hypothetical protein
LDEQDERLVQEPYPSHIIHQYTPPEQQQHKKKHHHHNNIHPTTPEENQHYKNSQYYPDETLPLTNVTPSTIPALTHPEERLYHLLRVLAPLLLPLPLTILILRQEYHPEGF